MVSDNECASKCLCRTVKIFVIKMNVVMMSLSVAIYLNRLNCVNTQPEACQNVGKAH